MSTTWYIIVVCFIWTVGGIAVIAHLKYTMKSLHPIVYGLMLLFWPFLMVFAVLSVVMDVIRAKGDTGLVSRAYGMRKKELESERDSNAPD